MSIIPRRSPADGTTVAPGRAGVLGGFGRREDGGEAMTRGYRGPPAGA